MGRDRPFSGNWGSENFVKSPCGIYNRPFRRGLSSNNSDLLIRGHFVLNTLHKASSTKATPGTSYSSKDSLNTPPPQKKTQQAGLAGPPAGFWDAAQIWSRVNSHRPRLWQHGALSFNIPCLPGPSSPAAKQQTVFKLRSAASSQEHAGRLVNREKIVRFETLRESQDLFC